MLATCAPRCTWWTWRVRASLQGQRPLTAQQGPIMAPVRQHMHLVDLAGARFAAGTASLGDASWTRSALQSSREHMLATKLHTCQSCMQRHFQTPSALDSRAPESQVVASAGIRPVRLPGWGDGADCCAPRQAASG